MVFIRRALPEPTIIHRTSALGVAGSGRTARVLNMTGKELLREITSYLGPPEMPVKVMVLRMGKDGRVSPANFYFSFKDKKMEGMETISASTLAHAGKSYVLDRMFEAAASEIDAKGR